MNKFLNHDICIKKLRALPSISVAQILLKVAAFVLVLTQSLVVNATEFASTPLAASSDNIAEHS